MHGSCMSTQPNLESLKSCWVFFQVLSLIRKPQELKTPSWWHTHKRWCDAGNCHMYVRLAEWNENCGFSNFQTIFLIWKWLMSIYTAYIYSTLHNYIGGCGNMCYLTSYSVSQKNSKLVSSWIIIAAGSGFDTGRSLPMRSANGLMFLPS